MGSERSERGGAAPDQQRYGAAGDLGARSGCSAGQGGRSSPARPAAPGRGIAAALGEAGATVICTGRSSRTGALQSDYNRSETIEETAELVTRLGGTGIAEVVDHLDRDQVARLAARVREEHGHLDVLVNDIWGGEVLKGAPPQWNTPIWEHDLDDGLRILRLAIDTHLITSHHLLPLLIERPGGLLVEVTDGTNDYNATQLPHLRLLRPGQGVGEPAGVLAGPRAGRPRRHGGRAHPGLAALRDDARGVRRHRGDVARRAGARRPLRASPTPSHPATSGEPIAALAADDDRARWNQQSLTAAQLAAEYGFTDVDGTQPDAWSVT